MNTSLGQQSSHHWIFLGLSTAVLVSALVLGIQGGEQVVVPVLGLTLPEACYFKRLFGFGCPGCGLTRCFISLTHGDFSGAWRFNPAGYLCFAVVAFQIPYRALQIWRLSHDRAEWRPVRLSATIGCGVVAALLVQWVWRYALQSR